MENEQARRVASLHSALNFVDQHYPLLTAEIRAIAENLRALVSRIDQLASDQMPAGMTRGVRLRTEADFVRGQMLRVAASTRRLYRDEPAMLAALRVPHKRAPVASICDAARTMCAALEPHRDYLIGEQVDIARIARLRERADSLTALEKALETATPRRQTATRSLPKLLAEALSDMQAIGRLLPEVDRTWEPKWKHVTRMRKRAGRPKKRPPKDPPPELTSE